MLICPFQTPQFSSSSSRVRAEQSLARWAAPQLHDIDALAKMVDPSLNGMYPAKSLSQFADIVALCVQVIKSSSRIFDRRCTDILIHYQWIKRPGRFESRILNDLILVIFPDFQPEPEFRPPMSEVVQQLVRLVQRASFVKRCSSDEMGLAYRTSGNEAIDMLF